MSQPERENWREREREREREKVGCKLFTGELEYEFLIFLRLISEI